MDSYGATTDVSVTVHVDNVPFGTVHVGVTAGNPIAGASVRLLAIDPATGEPSTRAGGPVLGQGGPTAADGTLTFQLTQENWDGPVQLEATGASTLSYLDPTDGTTPVSIPAAVKLTSYVPRYRTGETLSGAVTLYTTLADSAGKAFSQGQNPSMPAGPLDAALATTDPLFERHVAASVPWALRSTRPVSLTQPPTQTLRDVVFAALPDVALNQLARRIALSAGLSPGQGFDAVKLTTLLQRDISDGYFDGKEGGLLLRVIGSPSYELSPEELRVRLAVALDEFIIGPQNRTGLTRGDLRSAEPNVYDTLSLDRSALFPPDAVPQPFDANPPVVSWRVTFTGDNDVTYDGPVGTSNLVANTLAIEVIATDNEGSGVRSVTVTAGGNTLNGQETSANRVAGSWTPSADGSLELVAVAEDSLGNRGTYRRTLLVDNTPPLITVASPSAGLFHGAGALQLAAEASDANGVASHSVSGLSGATFTGTTSLTGSWTPASDSADGPLVSKWTACDLVGNCRVTNVPFHLDRTSPALSFASAPPQHTNAATITLSIAAADSGAGVVGVYGRRVGTTERIAATRTADAWSLTLPASAQGLLEYWIWGEDAASPTNSGETLDDEAHRLWPKVIRDVTAPVVELTSGGFYTSERDLSHREVTDGVPAVPVIHSGYGEAVSLGGSSTIYKLITKITPGNLTVEELTTTNASNTPWLAYSVLFSGQEAPITEASYSISCTGCGSPATSTGPLLRRSPQSGRERFALPLTSATIPGLLNATASPVTLVVRVTARDAAGNSTTSAPSTLAFHLVSPTVSIQEVSNYATARDPKSPYPYRMAGLTYDDLWEQTNPAFESLPTMRLARFRIRNPHPVAVAVNLTARAGTTWSVAEDWADSVRPDPLISSPRNVDGYSFPVTQDYDYHGDYYRMCGGVRQQPPYPCPTADGRHTAYAIHVLGDSTEWRCVPVTDPETKTLTAQRSEFTTAGYLHPDSWPTGGEPEVNRAPGGYSVFGQQAWLVPPANGSTPGQITLYLLVPRNRAQLPAITTAGNTYEHLYGLNYGQSAVHAQCRDADMNTYRLHRATRRLHYRTLSAARLSYTLPFSVNVVGTNGAAPLGAARVVTNRAASGSVTLTTQ
ncbi:hypothetical protein QEG98_41920 (plasmid) [Myxococcus sp. MxC21-1]|uniref:hypothetical protein n=1 Tax=Myxococcus sp. MxC21-1 TaxID=3041439 RepID=UPI00292F7510|nr:hypothetical protein [Myxococcus sp. MxC21-1]WNZ66227.1 hypothetical protein QEG98_41920 [Myxococcus sp. MxC21-1]